MVPFTRHVLDNGLRVLIHEDHDTPLVAVNVLYFVGSRDEHPDKTGLAHLFEHLMFAGSRHIQDFDEPLQMAGGENNAFTTNDYTTFYEILPAENLETALWLEADRMLSLRFNQRMLKVQQKVVLEEFKETCLNEPYGDSWHHLSEMMYEKHPYRWPVIGAQPEHIQNILMADLREFYQNWYCPANAVLSIAGKVDTQTALSLCRKWFGEIPPGAQQPHTFPQEASRTEAAYREVKAPVPVPAIYMAFRTPPRIHPDFYAADLLSDVLGHGQSSRLYRRLLKEQGLFSQVDAYLTANFDPGLLVIEVKMNEGVTTAQAIQAVWSELEQLKTEKVGARELEKVRHRFETTVVFAETSILNKAQNLGYYEALGDAELMNTETNLYLSVTENDLHRVANEMFTPGNSGVLVYVPN